MEKIMKNGKIVATAEIAGPAEVVDIAPIWAAPAVQGVKVETITIGDFLDWDNLALPVWQRASVWSDKQQDALADTIMSGRAIPALIIGYIAATPDGKKELYLLVDGRQRTEAIKKLVDDFDRPDLDDTDSAQLDYILSYPLTIMTVECVDATEAALLYTLYNSGATLSAIQRNKAAMPHDVLAIVQPYVDGMTALFGRKFGRPTTDSVAMMLAAGLASPAAATTAAASAAKVLMNADGKSIPAYPAALVSAYCEAVNDDKCPDSEYYRAAARFVPLMVAAVEVDATPEEVKELIFTADLLSMDKVPTSWTGKGKNPKTTKKRESLRAIFGNTANSAKATAFRVQAFEYLLTTDSGEVEALTPGVVDTAAAIDALR